MSWRFPTRSDIILAGDRSGSVVERWTTEQAVVGSKPTSAVFVLERDTLRPESTVNTQEVVAPSLHDRKIVDWGVKPKYKQTNNPGCRATANAQMLEILDQKRRRVVQSMLGKQRCLSAARLQYWAANLSFYYQSGILQI